MAKRNINSVNFKLSKNPKTPADALDLISKRVNLSKSVINYHIIKNYNIR